MAITTVEWVTSGMRDVKHILWCRIGKGTKYGGRAVGKEILNKTGVLPDWAGSGILNRNIKCKKMSVVHTVENSVQLVSGNVKKGKKRCGTYFNTAVVVKIVADVSFGD